MNVVLAGGPSFAILSLDLFQEGMAAAVLLSEQEPVSYVGGICDEPDSLLRQMCSSALENAGAHLPFSSALPCAVSWLLLGFVLFLM